MEPPGCFSAEIYAQDLGFRDAAPDLKVNFGEHMLRALFRPWAERWAERHFPLGTAANRTGSEQAEHPQPQSSSGDGSGSPDANG